MIVAEAGAVAAAGGEALEGGAVAAAGGEAVKGGAVAAVAAVGDIGESVGNGLVGLEVVNADRFAAVTANISDTFDLAFNIAGDDDDEEDEDDGDDDDDDREDSRERFVVGEDI